MISECLFVPVLPLPAVFDVGTLAEQEVAREVLRLRTLVEVVGSNETLEDVIEPIQERDPVEEVTSRERPFRRERFEGLGKKRERCRDGRRNKRLQPRRLDILRVSSIIHMCGA